MAFAYGGPTAPRHNCARGVPQAEMDEMAELDALRQAHLRAAVGESGVRKNNATTRYNIPVYNGSDCNTCSDYKYSAA
jgi:hypothetical protein